MTAFVLNFASPFPVSRIAEVPGDGTASWANTLAVQRLPSESIGYHDLTLTNVVVGSRILIRDQADTTTLYDQVAATSSVTISLPVYGSGSPMNDWRVKVRKASGSPNYIPYETLTVAFVGSQSIYVSQIPDE